MPLTLGPGALNLPISRWGKGEAEHSSAQNNCGSGQPPEPQCSWVPALPVHRWCGGMTLLARQRSQGVPHLPKLLADHDPKTITYNPTVTSGPNPAR